MMRTSIIAGTRITVVQLLRMLGAGNPISYILQCHFRLTEEDIHAAQAYAPGYLSREGLVAAG